MDWTIPQTFYPSALPASVAWLLFGLVCLGTIAGAHLVITKKGLRTGILLAVPIAVVLLLVSMVASMVLAFFVHDL